MIPKAYPSRMTWLGICASWLFGLSSSTISADEPIVFESQIAPIFQQHCVRCHSPGNKKGEVSLSTFDDLKSKEWVLSGKPDSSYLIELVSSIGDEPPAMPKEAKPLSKDEVMLLRRWIEQGAKWPNEVVIKERSKGDRSWWAYQPLRHTPSLLSTKDSEKSASDDVRSGPLSIDDFIRAKLAEKNLQRNPPANRRVLIRRATYDLIGLPPTPEEVEDFVGDPDPKAYEMLIDRLLASPHYGEHWGRHWLDVVRFGESIGYERNVIINDIWPFRDYVIRSINQDKPFDQLIREHLAGDVLGRDDPNVAVGSAFLVAGPYDDVGNQDAVQAAQIRANTLDEIISATGEAFLGMTLGCSRCHDHKFDPVSQEDYYGLYATFSGIRHGSVPLATPQEQERRASRSMPLQSRKTELEKSISEQNKRILKRAKEKLPEYEKLWTRAPVDRTGTEDRFDPVIAKFVRLVCEAQDSNPNSHSGFGIDEFEVWSAGGGARNVALASLGGKATGDSRKIEDFEGAYGPQLAIDGKTGARFLATGGDLTIELPEPTLIDRVFFSSARNETTPEQNKFTFVAEYRIEVSQDGMRWQSVAGSHDRKPIPIPAIMNHRLLKLETNSEDRAEKLRIEQEIDAVNREIAEIPPLPSVWIGRRVESDAKGPFHVFLGGNPQKKGDEVQPAGLRFLNKALHYELPNDSSESERRLALADWLVHPENPLTPRVLANRLWHYHFGTGIVDTPSDFGFMGGRPSHPELLDFLAIKLKENHWCIKAMHRLIMLSETYQQSSDYREEGAKLDGDSRLLWRFPPRRLSAEEVRDTMLKVAGKLPGESSIHVPNAEIVQGKSVESTKGVVRLESEVKLVPDGGPGFRLYHFMQDNVCTYVPLDKHGPETYRRAVYHQNARASVVDLMTEFDQPDCTFSTPRRAATTTPLQALTMLNHSLTLDMASFLAQRLRNEIGDGVVEQLERAFQLCYGRSIGRDELKVCRAFVEENGMVAMCRVLMNTSEMIYVP